jgi:hypothetical protein
MKTSPIFLRKKYFIPFVFLAAACGAEGLSGVFIPNIGNDWTSSRNSLIVITPKDTGVNESDFQGNESDDTSFANFKGHFKNYDVNFTFDDGRDAGVKYSGQFVKDSKPLQMRVTGTNGVSLTITKNN